MIEIIKCELFTYSIFVEKTFLKIYLQYFFNSFKNIRIPDIFHV